MFRMINPVREYAWGSTTAFSELFGWSATQAPQAELWMGAHATAPSSVVLADGGEESVATIGSVLDEGEDFPFLLKVLAAERPLSLQAHPGREHAEAGYAAEAERGVAEDSPERNYHDPHPKPELIVAVSEFIALCGFRPVDQALHDMEQLAELVRRWAGENTPAVTEVIGSICEHLRSEDYRGAVEYILRGSGDRARVAATLVNEVIVESALDAVFAEGEGAAPGSAGGEAPADTGGVPGLSAGLSDTLQRVAHHFPQDPSLFVVMLLHRVELQPGEALFLEPGQLHAYLEGTGIEMMTNSDNVLRGGLTGKHIDVDELLKVGAWGHLQVPRCPVREAAPGREIYEPPFGVLHLERVRLDADAHRGLPDSTTLEIPRRSIVLCLSGEVTIGTDAENGRLDLVAGESALLREAARRTLSLSRSEPGQSATVFIAAVPDAEFTAAVPDDVAAVGAPERSAS